MAVPVRLQYLLLTLWLLLASTTAASPAGSPWTAYDLSKRQDNVVTLDNGTMVVVDPETSQPMAQDLASDGSGHDFDAPAIIWMAWSFAVGVPLALAGIKLWRLTTGASLGIAAAALVWAAFINTLGTADISDLLLTCLVMGAFGLAFIVGLFNLGRLAGIAFLALSGGFSVGVRIVLFRDGLLVPTFVVNWIICLVFGLAYFFLVIVRQRIGIIISSASVGTFLTGLGIDLVVNHQKGMSTGLRFLFDRNNSHLVDLFTRGWHPPLVTIIILAVSLGLTPVLSFAQHKIFKGPFKPERPETVLMDEPDGESREPLHEPSSPLSPADQKMNQTSPSMQALLEKDSKSSIDGDPEKNSSSRFSM
ncbi:hypothetical protein QCA50_005247 [Cerrena zonata]|uniref:TM7S3/TM198-like domain-containing protein n=1 Tax=Cerrena zonata TaxID=2478898 RepID=A0AAW0GE99_9APHY